MDGISGIKEYLAGSLDESVFSPDSAYGIVLIVIVAGLIIWGLVKAKNVIWSVIGVIILMEIGHIAGFYTSVGDSLPVLRSIFKFDVLTALAQLCVGTKVSDMLLYVQAWLLAVMQSVGGMLSVIIEFIKNCIAALTA